MNSREQLNQRANYLAEGRVESLFPGPGLPSVLRARQPDREARAFLRMLNISPRTAVARASLRNLRQSARLATMALGSHPAVASVRERVIMGPNGSITL